MPEQNRTALDEELEGEIGRQLTREQGGIVLDFGPALLECVEPQEFVTRCLEQDSVVAALELSLFLEQGDAVVMRSDSRSISRSSPRSPTESVAMRCEDADDEDDDQDLDQRHAALGAAERATASPGLRQSLRFQLPMSASASSPPVSPSAPRE